MKKIFNRAQPFINLDKKLNAQFVKLGAIDASSGHSSRKDYNKQNDAFDRGTCGRYDNYTSLNTSRENIYNECMYTEFQTFIIKIPFPIKETSKTDKTRYNSFHKGHGHTNINASS